MIPTRDLMLRKMIRKIQQCEHYLVRKEVRNQLNVSYIQGSSIASWVTIMWNSLTFSRLSGIGKVFMRIALKMVVVLLFLTLLFLFSLAILLQASVWLFR